MHGPLKRIELADRLQGIDFIYTASGALKGINSGDPERDPGGDNTNDEFRDDVFGMTLDYYANDYSSPGFDTYGLTFTDTDLEEFGIIDQFTGNIRAQSWFSPVDNGKMRKLNGSNQLGGVLADFDYTYKGHTNQLAEITNGTELFRNYEYNAIGQLIRQTINGEEQFVQYDVSGKVLGVYKSLDLEENIYDEPIVKYTYDDRGFRLSAISYKGTVEKTKPPVHSPRIIPIPSMPMENSNLTTAGSLKILIAWMKAAVVTW
ncbi:MAG: hypothetical protein WD555_00185 [Fulvivirga sp.]